MEHGTWKIAPPTENCSTAEFVFGAGGLLLLSASSKSWPVTFLDGAWGLRRGSDVGAYLQLQLKLISFIWGTHGAHARRIGVPSFFFHGRNGNLG